MSLADDRILEYLSGHESGSPSEMKREGPIRYSRQHIARRCKVLANHGLVRHLGNGVYIITDRGEQYLRGELDTSEDAQDEPIEAGEDVERGPGEVEGENGGT